MSQLGVSNANRCRVSRQGRRILQASPAYIRAYAQEALCRLGGVLSATRGRTAAADQGREARRGVGNRARSRPRPFASSTDLPGVRPQSVHEALLSRLFVDEAYARGQGYLPDLAAESPSASVRRQ